MLGNGSGKGRNGRTWKSAPSLAGRGRRQLAGVVQTMNLPRFRTFLGSTAFFTARIMATSVGVLPQTSKWPLASLGQCLTMADDPGGSSPRKAEVQLAYSMAEGGPTASGANPMIRLPDIARPSIMGTKRSEEHTSELQSRENIV